MRDELSVFEQPDPATDVLKWPCIQLANVSIFADLSSSMVDITDVDADDDIEYYRVEGDIFDDGAIDPQSMSESLAFDAELEGSVVGERIRIYNVRTTVLRKDSATDNSDDSLLVDFEVLGESAWFKCLSPSEEYRSIFDGIIEKTMFWTWISTQLNDGQNLHDLDALEYLCILYVKAFPGAASFYDLMNRHVHFIVSMLLKDRQGTNALLQSMIVNPVFAPIIHDMSLKSNETNNSDSLAQVDLSVRENRKRKRSKSTSLRDESVTSPTSPDSTRADFLRSVTDLLSFAVSEPSDMFESAADVLCISGPKNANLSIDNDDFLQNAREFLHKELLFTAHTWNQLIGDHISLDKFCSRIRRHTQNLEARKDDLQLLNDYSLYLEYFYRLVGIFEDSFEDSLRRKDDQTYKDIIITNDSEETEGLPDSSRRSQKAVSRLHPPGNIRSDLVRGSSNSDDDDSEDDEQSIDSTNVNDDEASKNSISISRAKIITDNDDNGLELKKSADDAMFDAMFASIERKLNNFFQLEPVSAEALMKLPTESWTCPHKECSLIIDNQNSPEGRECIEQHYHAHAKQLISVMETLRSFGSGQQVNKIIAKVDDMTSIWEKEQEKFLND
ncbi:hypothetical protein V1511DRAFT_217061 [Dipodascopsis uninucleata]